MDGLTTALFRVSEWLGSTRNNAALNICSVVPTVPTCPSQKHRGRRESSRRGPTGSAPFWAWAGRRVSRFVTFVIGFV